jgi:hypothetical protein
MLKEWLTATNGIRQHGLRGRAIEFDISLETNGFSSALSLRTTQSSLLTIEPGWEPLNEASSPERNWLFCVVEK